MYKRVNLQPDPMKTYILKDSKGRITKGRWLVSNTYEGWYILDGRTIVPQDRIKVIKYCETSNVNIEHNYIPKKFLDEIFNGKSEIPFFNEPDILCYI